MCCSNSNIGCVQGSNLCVFVSGCRSGYHLFCRDQQASVSVFAQRWQKMTEIQKQEYATRCAEVRSYTNGCAFYSDIALVVSDTFALYPQRLLSSLSSLPFFLYPHLPELWVPGVCRNLYQLSSGKIMLAP